MSLGLRPLRAFRVAWAGALSVVLAIGLLLVGAGPVDAAPAPSPIPSPAPSTPPVSPLLPGILPTITLPTITLPLTGPVLGGVVSTVTGLGSTVQRTLNGVLAPRPTAPSTPTGTTPSSAPTPTAGAAPTHPTTGAKTSTVPRTAVPHPQKRRTARAQSGFASRIAGSTGASGVARAGVTVAAAPALPRSPAELVQRAADAVMHPGRALLAIIAITAICALGMLALVASLGRREPRSD